MYFKILGFLKNRDQWQHFLLSYKTTIPICFFWITSKFSCEEQIQEIKCKSKIKPMKLKFCLYESTETDPRTWQSCSPGSPATALRTRTLLWDMHLDLWYTHILNMFKNRIYSVQLWLTCVHFSRTDYWPFSAIQTSFPASPFWPIPKELILIQTTRKCGIY